MKTIEYLLPRGVDATCVASSIVPVQQSRAPRLARLLALAHRLDHLVWSGAIRDYETLARLGRITPSRLSQILLLLNLSPPIQEYLLFLSTEQARFLTEADLRTVAREGNWAHQGQRFEAIRNRRH